MVALIDTNVLVYRFDERFPRKQQAAAELMRDGIREGSIRVAHQAVVEFVAATTSLRGRGFNLLEPEEANREIEELIASVPVLYPNESLLRTAMRGRSAYGLPWYDAHMWAYAEHYGIEEILSEDFEHGRIYGAVRVRNPFRD